MMSLCIAQRFVAEEEQTFIQSKIIFVERKEKLSLESRDVVTKLIEISRSSSSIETYCAFRNDNPERARGNMSFIQARS